MTHKGDTDTTLGGSALETLRIFQVTLSEIYADVGSIVLQYARTGSIPNIEGLAKLRETGNEWHQTQDALRDAPQVLSLHDAKSISNMDTVHQLTSDISKNTVFNRLTSMLDTNPDIQMWFNDICAQNGTNIEVFVQSYKANLNINNTTSIQEVEFSM